MKFLQLVSATLSAVLLLCSPLVCKASGEPLPGRVTKFALCSSNVKSLILTKVPGSGTKWEFVITLNRSGARQFRQLELERPGELVDVVWEGVSFGKRRLDLPVQPSAEKLLLGSRWFNRRVAQAKLALVNERLLHTEKLNSPCGAIAP